MEIVNKKINLDKFFDRLRAGRSLLMIDYDGTLAPFKVNRSDAIPYPGVIPRLNALIKFGKSHVVIISGRRLAEVSGFLKKASHLEIWGSHGIERTLSNGKTEVAEISMLTREGIDKGVYVCSKYFLPEQIEIKPYGVAVHWRGLDNETYQKNIHLLEIEWQNICQIYSTEILDFDGGMELRPKGYNKGNAVKRLLNEPGYAAIAYLGDDLTDLDAFDALGNRGLKVLVNKDLKRGHCDIILESPEELLDFLDSWIENANANKEISWIPT